MKTESTIKPAAQFEIEAIPKKEGRPCVVIFFEDVQEVTRETMDGQEETLYQYDRYEVATIYREGLEESVAANIQAWLDKAKEAESKGHTPTEIEILQDEVKVLKAANAEMSSAIDDLVIASLMGGM